MEKPITTCSSAKAHRILRAQHGLQDRGRPQHRAISRKAWLEWKRRTDPLHYLDPAKRAGGGSPRRAGDDGGRPGSNPNHFYGTINCNGVNANGEICGVTTTSGLAWKIPGRVGDSPILGAGLYVDGRGRRRGLDGSRRGEPLQPVVASHRGEHAARDAPERRRHGRAEAHQGEHRREASTEQRTAIQTSASSSTSSTPKASTRV